MNAAVEAIDAPATRAVAVATIKSVALAKVREAEPVLRALAERYRDVVYDLKTSKGLADAKAARHDLRENGRYAVQRAEQAVRDEANSVKKEIAPEAERLIAIVQPLEDDLDKQIKAREVEIEAEKEAARVVESARVQKHREAMDAIRGYAAMAKGLPSERIQKGIDKLQAMVFGAETEEFTDRYTAAVQETVTALIAMRDEAKAREDEEARLAAQKAEQERVAADLAEQKRKLDEQAAELKRQQDELAATATAAAALINAVPVPAEGRMVFDVEQQRMYGPSTSAQPEASPPAYTAVHTFAEPGVNIDGCKFEYEQDTSAQQEAGQAATQGTAANPSPCHAQTASPEPDHAADAERAMNAPRLRRVAAAAANDAPIETTEADARPWSPSDGYIDSGAAFYDEPADLGPGLEDLAQALLEHIAAAFAGRFPSQPKVSQEWWADLKAKAASLRAHLNDEVLPG